MRSLRHVENHFVQQRRVSFFCFGSSKLIEDDNNVGIVFFILKTGISNILGLVALLSTNFGIHFFSYLLLNLSVKSCLVYLFRQTELSNPGASFIGEQKVKFITQRLLDPDGCKCDNFLHFSQGIWEVSKMLPRNIFLSGDDECQCYAWRM